MNKKPNFAKFILHIIGFSLCILPPAICTLCYFPLWEIAGGGRTLAGGAALLLVLCFRPLLKLLRRILSSDSAYLLWLILYIVFTILERIAKEIAVISLIGFIGNALGAICFMIAKKVPLRDEQ